MSIDNGSQGSASPSEYNTVEGTTSDGQANTTKSKDSIKAGLGVPSHSIHEAPQSKNRRRTSPHQLEVLNAHFVESSKPDIVVRQRLSAELGMTVREVQVWFQNRRAKQKKLDAKEAGLDPYSGGRSERPSYHTQLPSPQLAVAASDPYDAAYYGQQSQPPSERRPNYRHSTYAQSGEGPYPQELINALQHRVAPRPELQTLQPVSHQTAGIYTSSHLYPTPTGTRPTSATESSSVPSLSPDDLSTISSSYNSAHHFRPPALPTRNSGHSSRTSSSESIQHPYPQPGAQHISTSQPLYPNSSEDDAVDPYAPVTPISPIPAFPHSLPADMSQFRASPRYTKDPSFANDAAEMARRLSCPEGMNESFHNLQPYISSAPLLATSNSMQQQQDDARAGLNIRPASSGLLQYGEQVSSLSAVQNQSGYGRRHSVDVSQMGQPTLASRRSNALIKLQNMQRSAALYPVQEHAQAASAEGHTPSLDVTSAWNSLDSASVAPFSIPPSFSQQSSQHQIQTISGAAFAYTPDSAVEWMLPSSSGAIASSSRRESVSMLDTIVESSPQPSMALGLPMTDDSAFAYPPSWTQSQISDDPTASLDLVNTEQSISPVMTSPVSASPRRNSTAALRKMRSSNTFYQPYPTMQSRDSS